jgi:hypothetical protein
MDSKPHKPANKKSQKNFFFFLKNALQSFLFEKMTYTIWFVGEKKQKADCSSKLQDLPQMI